LPSSSSLFSRVSTPSPTETKPVPEDWFQGYLPTPPPTPLNAKKPTEDIDIDIVDDKEQALRQQPRNVIHRLQDIENKLDTFNDVRRIDKSLHQEGITEVGKEIEQLCCVLHQETQAHNNGLAAVSNSLMDRINRVQEETVKSLVQVVNEDVLKTLRIEVSKIKTLLSALTIGQEQLSILIQSKSQLAFAKQQGCIDKFEKNINSRLQQLESVLKHVTNSINHLSHQQQQVRKQNKRVAKTFSKEVAKKADLRHYNKIAQLRQSVINKRFNRLKDSSKHNSIQLHNIGGAIEPRIYTIESNTVSANNRIEHIESCLGKLVDVQASTDKSLKDYIEHQQRTNS
jgi:hypothetical protein